MAGKHKPDFWGTNSKGKTLTLSAKKVKRNRKKVDFITGGKPWSDRPNAPKNRSKPAPWWH